MEKQLKSVINNSDELSKPSVIIAISSFTRAFHIVLCRDLIFIVRFFVRDFHYNEQEMSSDRDQIDKLAADKKKMLVSEKHIFCESVNLRYDSF